MISVLSALFCVCVGGRGVKLSWCLLTSGKNGQFFQNDRNSKKKIFGTTDGPLDLRCYDSCWLFCETVLYIGDIEFLKVGNNDKSACRVPKPSFFLPPTKLPSAPELDTCLVVFLLFYEERGSCVSTAIWLFPTNVFPQATWRLCFCLGPHQII